MEKNYVYLQLFPTGTQHLIERGLGYTGSDWWLNHGHDNIDNVIQTELHSDFDDEGDGETGMVVALSFHELTEESEKFLNILNVKPKHIETIKKMSKEDFNPVVEYLNSGVGIERTSWEIASYLNISHAQVMAYILKGQEKLACTETGHYHIF